MVSKLSLPKSLVLVLAGAAVLVAVAAAEVPMEMPRNLMAPPGPDAIDATPEMLGAREVEFRERAAMGGVEIARVPWPRRNPVVIGEQLTIEVSDIATGTPYNETFVVVLDGTYGIVLLEKAAYDAYIGATDTYVFPNPNGCWRPEDEISTSQLQYLLDEFDANIYPAVSQVFGEPLPRGAEGQKTWILIHNIRDESYYNCASTSFVVGYFSAYEDSVNNKNMMHIDSYDWANRTGPDADRPFSYEGTFAHEFEHLVHFDQDPDEPSWVDEGMADLAGFVCGYGHSESHLAYYMVYHPFTPLTTWQGGLEDYGASYLFQLYLYEKFGGSSFTSALVQDPANGIEGIENTLELLGFGDSFDDIFDRWVIANYIDDTRKWGGKYGYETLDVGSIDTWGYSIEYALSNFWWGPPDQTPFAAQSDWLGDPLPYTAQYYRFWSLDAAELSVDGDDFAGTTAYSGTYEWYSDTAPWAWRSFYQTFSIPADGADLSFQTWYEIEDDWDYGYVEVYDHSTGDWYTLPATGTTSLLPASQDNPNTPDHREPTAYDAAGRWNAFTGSSSGWQLVTMDLDPFAGHDIDLYFTTWQDGFTNERMMFVDDIAIGDIGFFDDVEAGQDGWTTTGWYITDGILANGLGGSTLDTKWVPTARYPNPDRNRPMPLHRVNEIPIDLETQSGTTSISATPTQSRRISVAVLANRTDHGLPIHYALEVLLKD